VISTLVERVLRLLRPHFDTLLGKRIPMEVRVGDRVLYAKYTGQEVKIEQEEYIVLSEKDVLCKVQL
jgi:co-chaperonin GroES (HSP10)